MNRFVSIASSALLTSFIYFGTLGLATSASPTLQNIRPADWTSAVVVLHFSPQPRGEPEKIAEDLLRASDGFFARRTQREASKGSPTVFIEWVNMQAAGIEPPTPDQLQYFGRGISDAQATAMQKSKNALVLVFSYGRSDALKAVERSARFSAELARRSAALIWDGETRELFAVDEWSKARVDTWRDGYPIASKHTTIHAYKDGDYMRAISLGMRKFGLPDLVVADFSWGISTPMGHAINSLAQVLVEGAVVPERGPYDIRLNSIKHPVVRNVLANALIQGAKGDGRLTLQAARRQAGDPDNRLLEIAFDGYPGATVQERQDAFVSAMFGSADSVIYAPHTDEVSAASKRAQVRLESLRKRFDAGLRLGERLLVKAPFKTSDGDNEWMWVEVGQWRGQELVGLLRNQPEHVPGLRSGATVGVKQPEVFDYIFYNVDGASEGNETRVLLEKQGR